MRRGLAKENFFAEFYGDYSFRNYDKGCFGILSCYPPCFLPVTSCVYPIFPSLFSGKRISLSVCFFEWSLRMPVQAGCIFFYIFIKPVLLLPVFLLPAGQQLHASSLYCACSGLFYACCFESANHEMIFG